MCPSSRGQDFGPAQGREPPPRRYEFSSLTNTDAVHKVTYIKKNAPTFSENAPTFFEKAPTFSKKAPTFSENAPTFFENAPTFKK